MAVNGKLSLVICLIDFLLPELAICVKFVAMHTKTPRLDGFSCGQDAMASILALYSSDSFIHRKNWILRWVAAGVLPIVAIVPSRKLSLFVCCYGR